MVPSIGSYCIPEISCWTARNLPQTLKDDFVVEREFIGKNHQIPESFCGTLKPNIHPPMANQTEQLKPHRSLWVFSICSTNK